MTSINAMRLNYHQGLLVCDEARYWNPEWMIFYTPEKIRSVVTPVIQSDLNLVAFMGQTGTSSIGDEWLMEIKRAISHHYGDYLQKSASNLSQMKVNLESLAQLAFEEITRIKREHIDDFLRSKFGFDSLATISGSYRDKDGNEITIADKDMIKNAVKYMTFDGAPDEVKGIFGNSQIFAGYKPDEGFRIFYMTERWPVCEEVQEIFIAQGSGRDTCDLVYSRFADDLSLDARRHSMEINRSAALITLLRGVNTAMSQTAGVGGYPKVIWIDGTRAQTEWVTEISDRRSHLAAEIVAAIDYRLLSPETGRILIDDLIFQNHDFYSVNVRFWSESDNPKGLSRFLRGYK